MPRIVSNEELSRQAIVVPYVENFVARLVGVESLSRVEATPLEFAPSLAAPGWIIAVDEAGNGVAVCPRDVVPGRTPLRCRIEYARYAARVVTLFETGGARLTIRALDQERCPEEWRVYRARVGDDEAFCAVSYPPPPMGSNVEPLRREPRRARLRLWGWCVSSDGGKGEPLGEYDAIQARLQDQEQVYELRVGGEGTMIVRAVEHEKRVDSPHALGVRLDLGEVELGLEELLALRAGSAIEIAAEGPLRCFLRVGGTTLAAGELAVCGEKLSIRVTEALSAE